MKKKECISTFFRSMDNSKKILELLSSKCRDQVERGVVDELIEIVSYTIRKSSILRELKQ